MELLRKAWGGELPLWNIYWLWGVVGGLVAGGIQTALSLFAESMASTASGFTISLIDGTGIGLSLAYKLLWAVGTWRSAANYSAQNPLKIWGGLAKGVIVVGVLATIVALFSPPSP